MEIFPQNLKDNITYLHKKLNVETNFDVVYRVVHIGGREACLYFIDGFTKDESLLKNSAGVLHHQAGGYAKGRPRLLQTVCSIRRDRTAFQ